MSVIALDLGGTKLASTVDEIIVQDLTTDYPTRLRSYELLAEMMGLQYLGIV